MSILDQFRLDGKTALVTGAKRGIGKAIAVALAEAGAAVFLASSAADYVNGTIVTVDGGWMGR